MTKYRLVQKNFFSEEVLGVSIPVICNLGIFDSLEAAVGRVNQYSGQNPQSIERSDFEIQEIDE